MADKTVKTRIQIKRENESSWNTASTSTTPFKPLDGELIYYKDKKLLKIGNGTNTPKDLPVLADGCTKDYVSTEIGKLKFAGASTQGGAATSAKKLENTSVGSATEPVYFSSGLPVKCSSLPYAAGRNGIANAARMLVDDNDAALNEGYDDAATNPKHQPVYFKDGVPVAFDPGHATAASTGGDRPAIGAYHILKTNAVINNNHRVGTENKPIFINDAGLPQECTGITIPVDTPVNIAKQLQTGTKFTFNNGAISAPDFVFNGSANADGSQKTINIAATEVKEAYLSWGGKNTEGVVTPVDAAASSLHSANRFAFANTAGISIKYSRAGAAFVDYAVSSENKTKLISGLGLDPARDTKASPIYAGNRSASNAVNDKVEIEFNSKTMGVYTLLRKLLINVSKAHCTASVTVKSVTFGGTTSTLGKYNLVGWSGWNSIPMGGMYFGYSDGGTSNIEKLILTFSIDGLDTSKTANYLGIFDIVAIGETYWTTPSTLSRTGHMYEYDANKNVTFPGKVTTTGGFDGLATKASGLYGTFQDPTDSTKTKTDLFTVGDVDEPVYFQNGIPVKGKRIPNILTGTTAPTASVGQNGDIYLMPYANNMPAIYSGTAAPTSTLGVDGDIYILYE
jgi:hypothetical protein